MFLFLFSFVFLTFPCSLFLCFFEVLLFDLVLFSHCFLCRFLCFFSCSLIFPSYTNIKADTTIHFHLVDVEHDVENDDKRVAIKTV